LNVVHGWQRFDPQIVLRSICPEIWTLPNFATTFSALEARPHRFLQTLKIGFRQVLTATLKQGVILARDVRAEQVRQHLSEALQPRKLFIHWLAAMGR